MSHFVCIAKFTSKHGKETALLNALSKLVKPTKEEKGCISYDLHKDVNQPNVLTMIEVFKSKKDFEFHASQKYLIEFKDIAGTLVDAVNVTMCTTTDNDLIESDTADQDMTPRSRM